MAAGERADDANRTPPLIASSPAPSQRRPPTERPAHLTPHTMHANVKCGLLNSYE